MKIEAPNTIEAVLAELGQRLAHRRIEMNLTQMALAEQSGIGKRTIEAIEAGNDCQLSTLIRMLKTLKLTSHLDQLVPEATPSPIELVKLQGKKRQRASASKTPKNILQVSAKKTPARYFSKGTITQAQA
jgi:transcriptional regulator with XRE-family HTH domain